VKGVAGPRGEALAVERVRAGDLRAFEQLYKSYYPRLSRFLSNLLRRPHLVEEVLNDTMLVVWDKIEDFRGASRLSTWMFGIAYRQALGALRRLDEPVDDEALEHSESPEANPEQAAGQERARRTLSEAIERLSPSHRAVVNLTYFQEFGYREIAEIMDCPIDTVKTRMFQARRQLKQNLSGELADWM
jgi:RNA polymerase sigma-70 factor (ECF subfamily)